MLEVNLVLKPIQPHVKCFAILLFIESVAMPTAVILYCFVLGVGGCGCLISISVCLMVIHIFALMYKETYSASAADVTTV